MTSALVLGRAFAQRSRRALCYRKEFSTLVRADYELPGLPPLSPEVAKATSVSVTTLPTGLTVVTEDACTTSTVTMTYPKAGSASELVGEPGAALLNRCMAFRTGSGISTLMISRSIENEGGMPHASVNRGGCTLGYTVAPDKATALVPLLATDCSFEKWDVRDAKKLAELEVMVANENAQIVLTENLFAAAHGAQSPAGRSLYTYGECGWESMVNFRTRGYGLNGAVLTATGVKDHSAFCAEAEALLKDSPAGNVDGVPAAQYLGGESRVAALSSGYAHVALGFPVPATSTVANTVKHLLNLSGGESGVTGFCSERLLGVYAGSASPSGIIDAMVKVLKTSLSPDLVKRAKGLAKAEALFALDGGSKSLAEFMTAAVLEGGSVSSASPADVVKAYDAVTEAQVKEAMAGILKSNPSLAAVGDISEVPYQPAVAALLS